MITLWVSTGLKASQHSPEFLKELSSQNHPNSFFYGQLLSNLVLLCEQLRRYQVNYYLSPNFFGFICGVWSFIRGILRGTICFMLQLTSRILSFTLCFFPWWLSLTHSILSTFWRWVSCFFSRSLHNKNWIQITTLTRRCSNIFLLIKVK